MKIVGGNGQGLDNEKTRIVEIEPSDVSKRFLFGAHRQEADGVALWLAYEGDVDSLHDPVEAGADLPPPFWVKPQTVKPETWELLAQDLIKNTREGIVNIVSAACLQGMVISGWRGEAQKRLLTGLAMGIKEVRA